MFDLENARGLPVYVHAKVCIIDDVWMMVGSDNLNRRSWTNDSELSCAVMDEDGGTDFGRALRLGLHREHLERRAGDDADLVSAAGAFAAYAMRSIAWDELQRLLRVGAASRLGQRSAAQSRPADVCACIGPSRYRSITPGGRARCTERSWTPTVVRPSNGAGSGTDRRVAQPDGG